MKLENEGFFMILPVLTIDLFCDFLPMVKFWSRAKRNHMQWAEKTKIGFAVVKLENYGIFENLALLKIDLFCDFLLMVKFWTRTKKTLYFRKNVLNLS